MCSIQHRSTVSACSGLFANTPRVLHDSASFSTVTLQNTKAAVEQKNGSIKHKYSHAEIEI